MHVAVVADEPLLDYMEDVDAQHIEHSTLTDHETYTDSCRVAGGTMTSLNRELSTSDCSSYTKHIFTSLNKFKSLIKGFAPHYTPVIVSHRCNWLRYGWVH